MKQRCCKQKRACCANSPPSRALRSFPQSKTELGFMGRGNGASNCIVTATERDPSLVDSRNSLDGDLCLLRNILPLPEGEGWGEGECRVQSHRYVPERCATR